MVDTKQTKSVGEFDACAQLAMRGWAPALTRDGLAYTDIIATSESLHDAPFLSIQVKTSRGKNFPINVVKIPVDTSNHDWFILTQWDQDTNTLEHYIVPRNHVIAIVWAGHMRWLNDPNVPAGKRNAGVEAARIQATDFVGYHERWDLLEKPTDECPILAEHWIHEELLKPETALRPDHPWARDLPAW